MQKEMMINYNQMRLKNEWEIDSMVSKLGLQFHSLGPRKKIKGVSSIREATEEKLTFCWYESDKALSSIANSNAGVILCRTNLEDRIKSDPAFMMKIREQQLLFLDNPRLTFVQLMNQILPNKRTSSVSELAIIFDSSKMGSNCYIGDFAKIGDNCTVGNNTVIGDGVKLVQNCSVGNNCTIQPGVIIGADGFAFERHTSGKLERFPHVGGVRIGNNVEICSNTSIARGSLSDTIIQDGTKIDALVHIAHNVVIGKNCELTAGTIIGGSTTIGNMCWTGLNCTIKDNIKIGDSVIVASGGSVIRDIQTGDIVAGVPARSIKDKVTTNQLFLMRGQPQKQE
jgi:UDP-3-O-[3-hydroxymyristoyl] glucosamine N-acyltransferase